MKTGLTIGLLVALAALAGWGVLRLRQNSSRLGGQLVALKREARTLESLREENRRLHTLIAQVQRSDAEAVRAIEVDLTQARREIAELEQRAKDASANKAARPVAVDANRDPEKALTRLEHFQNVGQATPPAAFQTMVWAAMKGDDIALQNLCYLDDATRQKAQALLAGLPESAREKYPNPQSLVALAVAGELMRGSVLKIAGYTAMDSSSVLLTVNSGPEGKEAKLPMRQSGDRWQFVVPEKAVDAIRRKMAEHK